MKKRYLKKTMGVLLSLLLTGSLLTACGGQPAASESTENNSTKPAETVQTESTVQGDAEAEVEDWESEPVVLKATIVDYATCGYFEEAMTIFADAS